MRFWRSLISNSVCLLQSLKQDSKVRALRGSSAAAGVVVVAAGGTGAAVLGAWAVGAWGVASGWVVVGAGAGASRLIPAAGLRASGAPGNFGNSALTSNRGLGGSALAGAGTPGIRELAGAAKEVKRAGVGAGASLGFSGAAAEKRGLAGASAGLGTEVGAWEKREGPGAEAVGRVKIGAGAGLFSEAGGSCDGAIVKLGVGFTVLSFGAAAANSPPGAGVAPKMGAGVGAFGGWPPRNKFAGSVLGWLLGAGAGFKKLPSGLAASVVGAAVVVAGLTAGNGLGVGVEGGANIDGAGFAVKFGSLGSAGLAPKPPNRGAGVPEVGAGAPKRDGVVVCIPEASGLAGAAPKRDPAGWDGAPKRGAGLAGAVVEPPSPPKMLGTEFSCGF